MTESTQWKALDEGRSGLQEGNHWWNKRQDEKHNISNESDRSTKPRDFLPKQFKEAIHFNNHPKERPSEQNNEDSQEEAERSRPFMLLKEKPKRSFISDDEGKSCEKQDVSNGKQSFIKEQHDPQCKECQSKPRQSNTNLLKVSDVYHDCKKLVLSFLLLEWRRGNPLDPYKEHEISF